MTKPFLKHRIADSGFDGPALDEAIRSEWDTMEDERARGHHFLTWGARVNDFTNPCTFLVFNIGHRIVHVWIGAAAISGAEARAIADDNVRSPVEQMLESIKKTPRGWISSIQIKRSDFRLPHPPRARVKGDLHRRA